MTANANRERLMQVLLGPHISEKATSLAEAGQVVFKVRGDATKTDVRKAVELLFEVKVERVSVVRIPAKTKRFGQRAGTRYPAPIDSDKATDPARPPARRAQSPNHHCQRCRARARARP